VVWGARGAGETAAFAREIGNSDVARRGLNGSLSDLGSASRGRPQVRQAPGGLLAALTYILVGGGAARFSEEGYRLSLVRLDRHYGSAAASAATETSALPYRSVAADHGALADVRQLTASGTALDAEGGKSGAVKLDGGVEAAGANASEAPGSPVFEAHDGWEVIAGADAGGQDHFGAAARGVGAAVEPQDGAGLAGVVAVEFQDSTTLAGAAAAEFRNSPKSANVPADELQDSPGPAGMAAAQFQDSPRPADVATGGLQWKLGSTGVTTVSPHKIPVRPDLNKASTRAPSQPELARGADVVDSDDLHEGFARSRTRAWIEAVLGEMPESDSGIVGSTSISTSLSTSVSMAVDIWRGVLRDDAAWAGATLIRLGRAVRVRRRLAAVLPGEVVADLLALWLSPAQIDAVFATGGTDSMSFPRPLVNGGVADGISNAGWLFATLTYLLVEGGAWEFSEVRYRVSLARGLRGVPNEVRETFEVGSPGNRVAAAPNAEDRPAEEIADCPAQGRDNVVWERGSLGGGDTGVRSVVRGGGIPSAPSSVEVESGAMASHQQTTSHAKQVDSARLDIRPPHAALFDPASVDPTLMDHRDSDAVLQEATSVTSALHVDSPGEAVLAAAEMDAVPFDVELLRHLRGRVSSNSSTDVLRQALRSMVERRSAAVRRELLSALEYPGAGHRLAALVDGGGLPEVLHWLRPGDGAVALSVAARVARLSKNASDPTGRSQEDVRGSFSAGGDGVGSEADINTKGDAVAHIVNAFVLTELFEEGRMFDPEPFASRLAAALEARRTSPVIAKVGGVPSAVGGPTHPVSPMEDEAIDQRIYIANAGVVLVGPFLPRLFSMLELTNEMAFTSISDAHRAVHLIQYIVTGATTTPEPMLVLNKVLCGLPISEPVPLDIDLRAKERAAIEEMLTATIAHWKAIGSTSITGLRESFLQREGRLVSAEECWQLRVESKCFDMLIDRLPWGYTAVKFPWMKRVLHVDWR